MEAGALTLLCRGSKVALGFRWQVILCSWIKRGILGSAHPGTWYCSTSAAMLIVGGARFVSTLLKSVTISLFPCSGRDCCLCTTQPGDSSHSCRSLLLMKPTTVMSSANLIKRVELCDSLHSWVSKVKRRKLNTHPVFRVMVLEVLLLTCTA